MAARPCPTFPGQNQCSGYILGKFSNFCPECIRNSRSEGAKTGSGNRTTGKKREKAGQKGGRSSASDTFLTTSSEFLEMILKKTKKQELKVVPHEYEKKYKLLQDGNKLTEPSKVHGSCVVQGSEKFVTWKDFEANKSKHGLSRERFELFQKQQQEKSKKIESRVGYNFNKLKLKLSLISPGINFNKLKLALKSTLKFNFSQIFCQVKQKTAPSGTSHDCRFTLGILAR